MNSFLLKHLHHLIAADEQLVRVRNAIAGFENAEARLQAPGRGVVAFYSGPPTSPSPSTAILLRFWGTGKPPRKSAEALAYWRYDAEKPPDSS